MDLHIRPIELVREDGDDVVRVKAQWADTDCRRAKRGEPLTVCLFEAQVITEKVSGIVVLETDVTNVRRVLFEQGECCSSQVGEYTIEITAREGDSGPELDERAAEIVGRRGQRLLNEQSQAALVGANEPRTLAVDAQHTRRGGSAAQHQVDPNVRA